MAWNLADLKGCNIIDFNTKRLIDTSFLAFAMGSNCGSISDKEGNQLMYSNGCAIADRTHKILDNGDSINYGESWEKFYHTKYSKGNPVAQNSLILPDPGNYDLDGNEVQNGYYLLHKRSELFFEPKIHSWTP